MLWIRNREQKNKYIVRQNSKLDLKDCFWEIKPLNININEDKR